jgi:hypothetical protein
MRKTTFIALLVLSCCARTVLAQLPDETNGRVPELDQFHKPIFELWHDAWPAKDIPKLKALLPGVQKAYAALAEAKLPGILREKKAKWDEKLQALAQAMKEYRTAVDQDNSEGILKATESVHMDYEQMVRLVRPVMPELDRFHQSLYVLHHYSMPEYKTEQIEGLADSLMLKMQALNAASLPKRLENKSAQFERARKSLDQSVEAFAQAVKAKKGKDDLTKLENALHTRYQVLEKVFE